MTAKDWAVVINCTTILVLLGGMIYVRIKTRVLAKEIEELNKQTNETMAKFRALTKQMQEEK